MVKTAFTYLLIVISIIFIYELIRYFVKHIVIGKLTRSVKEQIRQNNIKLDQFKFMNKFIVKQELMNDPELKKEVIAHASEHNQRIQDVDDLVEEYIEEIVPFFNLLSYYKIGYLIANSFLNIIYEVVIDHENAKKLKMIPENHAVVFVMNHRSNVDYVLVAYMLAKNISISYAVGEWARVWPLEYIFKSFGAYFLRRRFRQKLYHLVLEKYIQLISLQGVTQGIFIEGGLTRDGAFRDTKVGVIDYIMKIKKNPEFKGDILFVPVGINYDWVLEDNVLIREWKDKKEKSGFKDNISSLLKLVFKGPFLLFKNTIRLVSGRLKQHGYASISFGDPVSVSQFLNKQKKDFFKQNRKNRLGAVKDFADVLIQKIGDVVPVTPLCLTSMAVLELQKAAFTRHDLIVKIAELKAILKRDGRRMVIGKAFQTTENGFSHLNREKSNRKKELVSFEEDFLDLNEAEKVVEVALDILFRRKILLSVNNKIRINVEKNSHLNYYANSIRHFFNKG